MSGRDWKHNTFKLSKWEAILFALALPFIFIVSTFGAAISALFSKKS
jgi:hypothetical protein